MECLFTLCTHTQYTMLLTNILTAQCTVAHVMLCSYLKLKNKWVLVKRLQKILEHTHTKKKEMSKFFLQ